MAGGPSADKKARAACCRMCVLDVKTRSACGTHCMLQVVRVGCHDKIRLSEVCILISACTEIDCSAGMQAGRADLQACMHATHETYHESLMVD